MSWSGNYQDSVTAPLGHMFDNDAVGRDDEDDEDEGMLVHDRSGSILSAIGKAGGINYIG